MFTIQRLINNSIQPFLLILEPGLRGTLLQRINDDTQLILGATYWGQPAGVAVFHVTAEAGHLSDLYVLPAYRRAGIGAGLLAAGEEAVIQAGLARLHTLYRPNEQIAAFEALLVKQGWQPPRISHIVFWTTRELDAPSLEWQKLRFEPPYEVVAWPDVTEADLQAIAKLGEEGRYSSTLSPFARPLEAWDGETSFVLRHEGDVVGWVCTVREKPLQLLIEILFVYPPRQRLGKMLIGEVTRRCWQIGMQDMYWRVAPDNAPMLEWSRRSFPDQILDEYEEWISEKKLGVDVRELATPEAIKAELQHFYERRATANLQTAVTATNQPAASNEGYGNHFYQDEELDGLPQSIVAGSIACGNPHAIAALQPGEVALDLGCGGGLDVLLAARKVGPTGFVYGVDMTAKMVELARRNAATVGATNVEFRQGDIESLPLPDNAVDVALANCVINLSPEQSVALAEAYRVLKPGGRLAFAEVMVDGDLSAFPLSEEDIQIAMNCAGCIFGALTIAAFTHLLEEAGFTEIEIIIQHRHTPDELLDRLPAALQSRLQALDPSVVAELIGCFTSSAIRARKGA
jgi:arsenite methyltransferase